MPEEDAFCVFVKLMQDYRMREIFKPTMAELGLCIFQLESMLQVYKSCLVIGKLYHHIICLLACLFVFYLCLHQNWLII